MVLSFANTIALEDIDLFVGMDVDAIIKNKLDSLEGERSNKRNLEMIKSVKILY